ncbi:hypothetical protein MGN70_004411 [Eutypa lata]|nr:hypothetical protein MGN70_004411 [Eutypa lata]
MVGPYQLPYYVAESQLPAPLPEPEEIAKFGEVIQDQTGRRIVNFKNCYIIKFGANVSLTEGMNMLYMHEARCEVSIPKVFAIYPRTHPAGHSIGYIIMEYIVGKRLDTIWPQLDPPEKNRISDHLRGYFDTLRSLPSPGYFGCIGKRPFEDSMFWTAPESNIEEGLINGPFDSEEQLNNALVEKHIYNSSLRQKTQFYSRVLPMVLQGHKPVFTHGDFQKKNVVIAENGTPVLIDWETAGWFPEYWEYALSMFACGAWEDDWHAYVAKILDEYPNEFAWFDMLRRELWS